MKVADVVDVAQPVEVREVPVEQPEPEPEPEPAEAEAPAPAAAAAREGDSDTDTDTDTDGSYRARRGAGFLGGLVALLALGGLAGIGLLVTRDELMTTPGIALSVVTGVLLLITLLRTSSDQSVTLQDGTLKLVFGDRQHTFYLTSASTQLEMVGEPGHRGWRILILRRGMPPVVIDSRTVEPHAFTAAVRHWRPEL